MPLNKQDKKDVVASMTARIAQTQTVVLAQYRGMSSSALAELRAKAREQKVYLRVLKNTLMRRVVDGTAFAPLAEHMIGPLIYSFSEDAVSAAKVIYDFAKSNDKLVVQQGYCEGKVLDRPAVEALASIPSREELLARLLGVMQAPVSGFARALAALAAKKQEAEGVAESAESA